MDSQKSAMYTWCMMKFSAAFCKRARLGICPAPLHNAVIGLSVTRDRAKPDHTKSRKESGRQAMAPFLLRAAPI